MLVCHLKPQDLELSDVCLKLFIVSRIRIFNKTFISHQSEPIYKTWHKTTYFLCMSSHLFQVPQIIQTVPNICIGINAADNHILMILCIMRCLVWYMGGSVLGLTWTWYCVISIKLYWAWFRPMWTSCVRVLT